MRRKIIQAFLGVYLALSLVYGGIRAAYLTAVAAMTPPQELITLATQPTFGQASVPAQPSQAPIASPAPSAEPSQAPSETSSAEPSPAPSETPSAGPSSEPSAVPSEAPSEEPTPEPSAVLTEPPAEEEDQEASLEAAPAPEIPSLEDYLSQLHCGGCGRNCLLSSPRCRTGKRKAETYTTEYYTEYGTTDEI